MAWYEISDKKLTKYIKKPVNPEKELQDFIEKHPEIIGEDILILGRETKTARDKRIDLLGLNENGDVIIIETKKDKTPRDVESQILDYYRWVKDLKLEKLSEITKDYKNCGIRLYEKYESKYNKKLPDYVNQQQKLFIIAREIDDDTKEIAEDMVEWGRNIFCMELNFYEKDGREFCNTKMVVGKEETKSTNSIVTQVMKYDWEYYSKKNGWDDEVISKMKELIKNIFESNEREHWNDIVDNFKKYYYSIQIKNINVIIILKKSLLFNTN